MPPVASLPFMTSPVDGVTEVISTSSVSSSFMLIFGCLKEILKLTLECFKGARLIVMVLIL